MNITLNGAAHVLPDAATVAALLAQLGVDARTAAVERNLVIVPRSAYDDTVLAEDDRIELVEFVGGG